MVPLMAVPWGSSDDVVGEARDPRPEAQTQLRHRYAGMRKALYPDPMSDTAPSRRTGVRLVGGRHVVDQ